MIKVLSELWMLKEPVDVFFFDFDGTLSLMEGIDVLANLNGVSEQVHAITQRCMAITGLSVADYQERLTLVQPHEAQLKDVAELYRMNRTPGALETITLLKYLGKKVYIISAGIKNTLLPLAADLNIPPDHVLAVDVYFNNTQYAGFDEQSYMVQAEGKNKQIQDVLEANERAVLVGDGVSDWEARSVVARFIGFAGLNPKDKVRDNSDFFINTPSLYSVIHLGLTYEEQLGLPEDFWPAYNQGLADINNHLVFIKE